MTALSMLQLNSSDIVKRLESVFAPAKHVVDIGGGQGALASKILRDCPHLTATVFDLV